MSFCDTFYNTLQNVQCDTMKTYKKEVTSSFVQVGGYPTFQTLTTEASKPLNIRPRPSKLFGTICTRGDTLVL